MSMATARQPVCTEMADTGSDENAHAKRVLVVSFDFPPRRTSAVYRMVGLTGSLPQLGWQPAVLTIKDLAGPQDPGLLEKLPPGIHIAETRYLNVNGWEDAMWNTARKAGMFKAAPDDVSEGALDRCLRLGGRMLRSALYFPDERVGWIPFAFARAIRLHREKKFDLVYTTSPPRTTPVIGMLLKRLFGLPWVSEFMDPWYPTGGILRQAADERLFGHMTSLADRIVVMVPEHAQQLERQFGLGAEKIAVVRNGFDENDFVTLETTPSSSLEPGFFHIGHFGTVYPENEGCFFPALRDLLNRRPALRKRVRLHIVGAAYDKVLQDVQQDGLKDITEVHGFLPHAEALQMMRACDCLLLLWGRRDFSRLAVAGKTYEYLRVGRPILAVTGEGGVKGLVEGAGAGWVAPPDDVEAIQKALLEAIEKESEPAMVRHHKSEFVAQFRWDRQARILAETFNEALAHGS